VRRILNICSLTSEPSATRRQLLLAAPLAPLTALVPAIASAQSGPLVGVLLPNSERIPGLRMDWRHGFQAELMAANASVNPQYLEYPVGSHRALAAAQALLDRGCTTLTGIFNRNLATHLGESLDRRSATFLVSDLGANAIRGDGNCDRLVRVGPNLWHQAYLAGQHFAQLGGKRALIATSFYEAGYDLPGAFQCGFIAAGGDRADTVVTGTPDITSNAAEFTRLEDALSGNAFDVLFSLYSGREATRYLQFAQTIHKRVGTIASLSPLLHGLPQSAAVRASKIALEVVTAHAPNRDPSIASNETIYTSMGRVAARAVLASLAHASRCPAYPEWSTTIALAPSAGAATRPATLATAFAATDTTLASPWPAGITSGWIAPYGA